MSQNPLDRIKNVDWRGLVKTATNKVKQYTMNLSPLEIAVEEATNMDSWGPHGSAMNDIAEACYDSEGYHQVLGVIARRLQEKEEKWRMCYKALLLLDYLLKHGPPKVADDVVKSMSVLEKLQDFQYKDANGRDHGANVRHRALEIVALVNDPVKLQEEREKASINKTKYIGVSGEALRTGGFGGGNSGSAFYGASSTMTSRSRGLSESTSIGNYSHQPSWQHEPSSKANERRSPSISPRQRIEESSQITDSTSDAVAATRARIQKLKLGKQSSPLAESGVPFTAQPTDKKKLTLGDVHVNPKIAASLGLKPVTKTLYKDAKDNNSVMNESIKPGDGGEVDLLGLEQEQKQKQDDAPSNFADWNAFDQQPSLPDTSQAHKQAADSLLADKKQGESGQAEQSGVTRDPFDDLTTARSVTARSRATALPEDMFSSTSTTPQGSQSVASVAKIREQTSRDQDLFADLLT